MAKFDYKAAQDAGYSDDEIKSFIGSQKGMQVVNAPTPSTGNPVLDFLGGAARFLAPQTTNTLTKGVDQLTKANANRPNAQGNLGQAVANAAADTGQLASTVLNPKQIAEIGAFALPGGEIGGAARGVVSKVLPGSLGEIAGKIAGSVAPGAASGALQGASTGDMSKVGPDAALGGVLPSVLRGLQHPIAPLGQEVDKILGANPAQLDTHNLRTAFDNGPLQDLYKRGYGDKATQAGQDVFSGLRQAMDSYNRGKTSLPDATGGAPFVPSDSATATMRGTPMGTRYTRAASGQLVPADGSQAAAAPGYALDTNGTAPYAPGPQLDSSKLNALSLLNANSYKRNLYHTADESYGKDTGKADQEAMKGLASVLKGAIEQQAPGVTPYNQLMTMMYKAPKAANAVASSIPGIGKFLEKVAGTVPQRIFQHVPTQNPLSRFLLQFGGPAANNQGY